MPKIIGGSIQEHRAQTRHKLYTALSTLMAERGFDSITLADIAGRADVGRTAVYNHFADKDALLLGFIAHETEQYVATLTRALDEISDPVEQLRVYVRQNARLRTAFSFAPGPDLRSVVGRGARSKLGDHATVVENVLRRIIQAGIDSAVFADQDLDITVPLVNACLRSHVLDGSGVPRADRETVAQTEAFVLRAVGAHLPAVAAA
ncbi:MAG: TetR/AcrR family transcriptional regulator [Actinomycetales bacterium]|nr:TetR/AcrR family transcriptional regulator [Actinomycetales bacterium]